jgi:hypothetical protein
MFICGEPMKRDEEIAWPIVEFRRRSELFDRDALALAAR